MTKYYFQDLIEIGKQEVEVVLEEPKPETIYMICYTSGTTGDLKGVMIAHESFVSLIHLADQFMVNFDETDIAISYLPHGHTFEKCIFIFSLFKGFSHGYYSGDPLQLLDDIQELKPTLFCSVPRILNRVYSKIHESVET